MKTLILATLMLTLSTVKVFSQEQKDFELKDPLVPQNEIVYGGVGRDGIPAINNPVFMNAEEAAFLDKDDRVLGVIENGVAKAYPLKILNWHEVVNDDFDGVPVAVTYCPLCGCGISYNVSQPDGGKYTFKVSGFLYNNDLVMYDIKTESLWSQMLDKAISGPLKGEELENVPTINTTWKEWKKLHPDTKVLSTNTGYTRDYSTNPYGDYEHNREIYFLNKSKDNSYHPKEKVIGIEVDGKRKVYPFSELKKTGLKEFKDSFNGKIFTVAFNSKAESAIILDDKGNYLPGVMAYWFAWDSFLPDSEVYELEDPKNQPGDIHKI